MKWISYGPDAWLLRFADVLGPDAFSRGRAIAGELERNPPPGLREYVPGFTTVLLEFEPGAVRDVERDLGRLTARLRRATPPDPRQAVIKEIPVVYDGPDLPRVAAAHGLTEAEVIRRHSSRIYHVYLLGFSPGFPYLGELDPSLHTPRLPMPRPRVAAGSVAIGGEHTGIYSVDSPGGWNIIGRTSVRVFDPVRGVRGHEAAMFHLQAGNQVRFVPETDGGASRG